MILAPSTLTYIRKHSRGQGHLVVHRAAVCLDAVGRRFAVEVVYSREDRSSDVMCILEERRWNML